MHPPTRFRIALAAVILAALALSACDTFRRNPDSGTDGAADTGTRPVGDSGQISLDAGDAD